MSATAETSSSIVTIELLVQDLTKQQMLIETHEMEYDNNERFIGICFVWTDGDKIVLKESKKVQ